MRWPVLELFVLERVRINVGNQKDPPFPRRIHQASEVRNNFLRARHIELSARQQEVRLCVHVPEDRVSRHYCPLPFFDYSNLSAPDEEP